MVYLYSSLLSCAVSVFEQFIVPTYISIFLDLIFLLYQNFNNAFVFDDLDRLICMVNENHIRYIFRIFPSTILLGFGIHINIVKVLNACVCDISNVAGTCSYR